MLCWCCVVVFLGVFKITLSTHGGGGKSWTGTALAHLSKICIRRGDFKFKFSLIDLFLEIKGRVVS